jgi:GxxExxY protein
MENDPQTFAIIGAAIEVHKELGSGFLESVYQEALAYELTLRNIPFQREYPITVKYKGNALGTPFRADFLCYESIIVELKSIRTLTNIEEAQTINYLKATGFRRAVLINFGGASLEQKRFVLGYKSGS